MLNLNQVQIMQNEHRKDLLRQAEHSRLVKVALVNDRNRVRLYQVMLAWTGRSFVTWGYRLLKLSKQERIPLYQPNQMVKG